MADVKISELPAASTINNSVDVLPIVTDGGLVTSRATPYQVLGAVLDATPIPSIGAVATGAIGAGYTVILNSDGTVSAVTGTASVIGTPGTIVSGIKNAQGVYVPNGGRVVVVYQETTNHYIQLILGTLSGSTIIFGSPTTIATGDLDDLTFPTICVYEGSALIWVTYSPTSDNQLYIIGVDTYEGVISLGTPVLADSTYLTSQAVACSLWVGSLTIGGKPCIAYQTTDGGIRATTFSMSGTSITSVNASIELSTSTTTEIDGHQIDGTNVVFFFTEGSTGAVSFCEFSGSLTLSSTTSLPSLNLAQSTYSTSVLDDFNLLLAFAEATTGVLDAVVLELNYTTYAVTFGNRQLIDTTPSTGYGAISTYTYPNGTVGIFYNSQALDNLRTTVVQVDDGNIIKVDGVTTLVQGGNSSYMWTFPLANPLQNAILYYNGVQNYVTYTASTTNLTDKNFIGYSYADYANGDTAIIQTLGSTIASQAGLTPGVQYYVTETGDPSATPGVPVVNAGTGLTTTSLLFNN